VTSRRPNAPGHRRPDRRGSGLFLLILAVLLVAACGDGTTPTFVPTATATGPATGSPSASSAPGTSEEPTESASDEPSEAPSDEPSEAPSDEPTASPSPSGSGVADACTGTAKNKDFYASVAASVDWPVYCPSLPAGWNVVSGQYRLAGGGRLEIGYKGPAGAKITLSEGAFCQDTDGCVPSGTEIGDAAFGDKTGTLIAAADGTWVIVVAQGANPSWLLVAQVASQDAARAIGSSLIVVGD
jgi:hypothetical protein